MKNSKLKAQNSKLWIKVGKDETRQVVLEAGGTYVVELKGEGARAKIVGGFWLKGKEQLELNVEVRHKAQKTQGETQIRVVVEDQAQAAIKGKIRVAKGANLTNSFLSEKVLLVSKAARATAIPELEIEADEVKCSHAATVGTIDAEQLFYLMSRGLAERQAKIMLIKGFLAPVMPSKKEL